MLSSDESPPSPILSGPLERRPVECVCVFCVRVCLCLRVAALRSAVIIRIRSGFDSRTLERWTQHMSREITGWLTGYVTDWRLH